MRWLVLCLVPIPAMADTWAATRVLRAGQLIAATDVALMDGMLSNVIGASPVIGQEARVALYPGRPILPDQVGPPSIIGRNQTVTLVYLASGLAIQTEGRALDRGGAGEMIRVINLSSRTTVQGLIQPDGTVRVGPPQG